MAEKKYSDEEIEELDGFLQYRFFHDIYEELTSEDEDYFALFEPLDFFRLFESAADHIDENKTKPFSVSKYLNKELRARNKQLLKDKQRYFLYEKLLLWFSDERQQNQQIEICCREISKLLEKLDVYQQDKEDTPTRKDPFENVLRHLETLPNYKEKIAYLIQEKTRSEQRETDWDGLFGTKTFAEKCELEIIALRQLMQLEAKPEKAADRINKHNDLTLDRAALTLNYLLTYAKANCHNTEKAKFISFLTGYSEKQIAQKLSKLHKKEDENYTAYERDMKVISQYFAKLGLTEITNQIGRDIGKDLKV